VLGSQATPASRSQVPSSPSANLIGATSSCRPLNSIHGDERWEKTMANEHDLEKQLEQLLERQLADAQARIREMIREIDRRDELIADLQRRIQELEQAANSQP
jgi:peptidoglycan hydrolase CwlO-like protein